jgi:GGDEF domain-containing protein
LLGYASLPLVAGDELVGLLSIQFGRQAPRGRGAEETFQEIAAVASDEIAQAEREARFATRATKVSALNESGMRMIATHDPGEVARLATSAATLLLDADHAVLRLRDDTSGRFVIRSYFGPADGRQQEEIFRLDRHVSLEAAKRRSVFCVRDLAADPALRDAARGVRSALAAPLKRDGRPIGTLCVYDKVASDRFFPGVFNDDDQSLFARLVAMVERALASALQHAHARQHRSFDDETGLPNASYLARRLDEEIARGNGRADAFALVVCRIESFAALVQEGAPGLATRALRAVADALRAHLRDFDVLARWDDAELAVLLPDPGRNPEDRISTLARHVAEEVRKDERLNEPAPIALSFGYALASGLADSRDAIMARATVPRIRMV